MLTKFFDNIGPYVVYYPRISDITGSVNSAILLCFFLSFKDYLDNKDGVEVSEEYGVYIQQDRIQEKTGLTPAEQRSSKAQLEKLGFMSVSKKGLPAKHYYKLNNETIDKAWESFCETRISLRTELQRIRTQGARDGVGKSKAEDDSKNQKSSSAATASVTTTSFSEGKGLKPNESQTYCGSITSNTADRITGSPSTAPQSIYINQKNNQPSNTTEKSDDAETAIAALGENASQGEGEGIGQDTEVKEEVVQISLPIDPVKTEEEDHSLKGDGEKERSIGARGAETLSEVTNASKKVATKKSKVLTYEDENGLQKANPNLTFSQVDDGKLPKDAVYALIQDREAFERVWKLYSASVKAIPRNWGAGNKKAAAYFWHYQIESLGFVEAFEDSVKEHFSDKSPCAYYFTTFLGCEVEDKEDSHWYSAYERVEGRRKAKAEREAALSRASSQSSHPLALPPQGEPAYSEEQVQKQFDRIHSRKVIYQPDGSRIKFYDNDTEHETRQKLGLYRNLMRNRYGQDWDLNYGLLERAGITVRLEELIQA